MSNEIAAPDEAERQRVCGELAAKFPERVSGGYVAGFYVYDRNERKSGPHPTKEIAEARAHAFFGERVVLGHVFTPWGTVVQVHG